MPSHSHNHTEKHGHPERRRKAVSLEDRPERRAEPHNYSDTGHDRLLVMLKTALGPKIGGRLMSDDVTEIMVSNSDSSVWVKYIGLGWKPEGSMRPEDALRVLNIAAHAIHISVTPESPSFSAELPGSGYRFNGNIPPGSPVPGFNIRKKPARIFTLDDYINHGIMKPRHAEIIIKAVADRTNILIVGGTESGKTTLTNAVLAEIAKHDVHVLTIEDTLELMNSSRRRTEFRTVEGSRSMADWLKEALRRSPDRIVVGEVRGGEAWDMLMAWNTGHPGGACTAHADSCIDGLTRIEMLSRMSPSTRVMDVSVLRSVIARAVGLVVYIAKIWIDTPEGLREVRRVLDVVRVTGLDEKDNFVVEQV